MRNTAIFAVVALCVASFSVANGALAGLRPNFALTEASREDRFDIVTINPTTGVAASTQKQVYGLYDGAIDMTNVVFTPNGLVFSLQAYDQSQSHYHFRTVVIPLPANSASQGTPLTPNFGSSNPSIPSTAPGYLTRQDLRNNGKFEYCELSLNSRPINIFLDNDNGVVALVANPTTAGFSLTRISFSVATGTQCQNTLVTNLPALGSVSANVFHQRGNRVYFVNEPSSGFTSTAAGVQIRSYDITGTTATAVATVTLPSTVIPVTLGTLSGDVIVFNAWNSAASGTTAGFLTYELNMNTYTSATVLTTRSITASAEELSFTATMVNQTNSMYSIKNAATTANTFVPQLVWTSFHATSTAEQKTTSNMGTTAQVFRLFELGNATIVDFSIDSTTATSFAITGLNTFASVSTGTGVVAGTIAQCRLTYVGGSTTPVVGAATGSGNAASCAIGAIPAGTNSIDVEFAADGVNYGPKSSFAYQPTNSAAIVGGNFVRQSYDLRDGTPLGRGAEVVTLILRDAAGRKVLFHPTTTITLTLQAQGQTVIRSVVGNSAPIVNGVVTFPNLAVDIDVSESNAIGIVRASVTFGTNTVSTVLSIRQLRKTFGTLAALAFPTTSNTQSFETHLINPSLAGSALAAVRLTTRSLAETGATLGLGTTTYDRDNKVLNTLEVNAAGGAVLLNGVSMGPTSTNAAGTGVCKLPTSPVTSTNIGNDVPSNLFYESTTTAGSNFLGVVHFTENTPLGFGRKIVRYTRVAGSAATTTCTSVTVDNLPLWDAQYGNHHIQLLTGNRMAFIEPDYFFTASNQIQGTSALLHVWQMSNGTANTGSWLIRNKVISGFSVLGVTQSGEDELSINGISTDTVPVHGVWTIDIASQFGAVTAPTTTTATRFASTTNEQALFLSAGADGNNDSRLRYTGTSTAYTTTPQLQFIDTVQLSRGLTTPSAARNVDHSGRNYLDFFVIEDPSVQTITPSRISLNQVAAITVTANNVITSSQLKCRFSSASGVPSAVTVDVGTATTSTALNADGTSVSCGSIPISFTTSNSWVYVQLSNDGGLNYGPEKRLAIGTISDAVNPTNAPVAGANNIFTVSFNIKFLTNLRNPTTAQDTAVRAAITSVLNQLSSIWTKSAITSSVETDGTTSYSITVTTTTSSSTRMSALQLTTATSAQLQQEILNAVQPNGVLNSVLTAAGVTNVSVSRAATASSTSKSDDLSDGAIAGIVIGSIVGFFLIVGIIAFLVVSNKKATATPYSAAARARSADVGVVSNSSSGSSSSSSSSASSDDDYYYDDYSEDDYSDYI